MSRVIYSPQLGDDGLTQLQMLEANMDVTILQATLNPQPQAVAGLSQHGIGIWPTQLPQYAEAVSLANDAPEDTLVPKRAIHEPQPAIFGDWQELVHLLGGTYYYNTNKNTYTLVNLRNYQYLQMLDDFIDAS
ncbi:hypothetical protein F4604DRAFT_1914730 [Suillus subluteus]|nr:hypothetical protein F4604DRAFT_1914730 [Suillus subluteus]